MNLAILLGVDTYKIPGNNLPGCINDLKIMFELLSGLNKFDDILVLNQNEDSKIVKNKIIEFIKKYSNIDTNPINEFLFYFTGHGKADENDFYYILSDYTETKSKQTSLENSELDTWIRQLNPKTTIKIVDACYSGMPYIKDTNSIQKLLDKAKGQINDCYFMFSSKITETSKQNNLISFFTHSFINSVTNSPIGDLRYKEIMDYILDYFSNIEDQTPYFVNQGDFTATLGNVTKELQEKLMKTFDSFKNNHKNDNNEKSDINLIDIIKSDSEKYCTEENMLNNIDKLKTYIENYTIQNQELKELYSWNPNFFTSYPIQLDTSIIGKWFNKNNNYFAKPIYKKEPYTEIIQVKKTNPYDKLFAFSFADNYEDKEITKYKNVISGFELTQYVPYNSIEISYIPNLDNLKRYSTFILYAFSKTNIIFFTYTSYYKDLNWSEIEFQLDSKWKSYVIPAKDFSNVSDFINNAIISLEKRIINELYSDFNISPKTC
ncbi:caspase family protein [Clostridium sp. C2-6-12]|uniref:caspase family protein n=1 Tax=Clostridium sp. C2-6-12 TaxID=2698832 RepID=UPI00136FC992|nr:caspase family protein [Clostridium sp. C2-6-12]